MEPRYPTLTKEQSETISRSLPDETIPDFTPEPIVIVFFFVRIALILGAIVLISFLIYKHFSKKKSKKK